MVISFLLNAIFLQSCEHKNNQDFVIFEYYYDLCDKLSREAFSF